MLSNLLFIYLGIFSDYLEIATDISVPRARVHGVDILVCYLTGENHVS